MKKFLILLCAALALTAFAACSEDTPPPGPSAYSIVAPESEDYEVSVQSKAFADETVTVRVKLQNPAKTVTGVNFNGTPAQEQDGSYTFKMPGENVTITVTTAAAADVIKDEYFDSYLQWDENLSWFGNGYTFVTAENDADYDADPQFGDPGEMVFSVNSAYMTNAQIVPYSSDSSVIPVSAITVDTTTKADAGVGNESNEIIGGTLYIDLSEVSTGTAKIALYVKNNNLSGTRNEFIVVVTVKIVEAGELEQTVWIEPLKLDFGSALQQGELVLRVFYGDYVYGSAVDYFQDYALTVEGGIAEVSIDYVKDGDFEILLFTKDLDHANYAFEAASSNGAKLEVLEGRVFKITFGSELSSPFELSVVEKIA